MKRIFLIGFMGSGKTTMGKILANNLNLNFIDLDIYIENKYRKTVMQIFEEEGEVIFREKERACLHEVSDFDGVVISTGGGTPCFFDNMDYMNSRGKTIYLKLHPKQLARRLSSSKAQVRPLVKNKTGDELFEYITQLLATREPFYLQSQRVVEGSDKEIRDFISRYAPYAGS